MRSSLNNKFIVAKLATLHSVIQDPSFISEKVVDELQFIRDFIQHIDNEQKFYGLNPMTDDQFIMCALDYSICDIEKLSADAVDPDKLEDAFLKFKRIES